MRIVPALKPPGRPRLQIAENCVFPQRSEETQSEGKKRRLGKAGQNSRAGIEDGPAPEFFAAAAVKHGLGAGTAAENADQPAPIPELA